MNTADNKNGEQRVIFVPKEDSLIDPAIIQAVAHVGTDWEMSYDNDRIVIVSDITTCRKGVEVMPGKPLEAAAFIRVVNTFSMQEYRYYLRSDDQELLAFDNGDVMDCVRQLGRYPFLHLVIHNTIESEPKGDDALYVETDIRPIPLRFLHIELMAVQTAEGRVIETPVKQMFPPEVPLDLKI